MVQKKLGSESIEVGIIRESPEFNGGGTNSPGPRMNWSGKGEAFGSPRMRRNS